MKMGKEKKAAVDGPIYDARTLGTKVCRLKNAFVGTQILSQSALADLLIVYPGFH